MQKFVPQSDVEISRNKLTQSTPLDPKLMFWCIDSVWLHLGSFHNCMKLVAKWGQLVQLIQKFVPRSHVEIFGNERTQSTPLDPKLMFWCVS
jgi:hypothetical protein